jgi:hypothetical protein
MNHFHRATRQTTVKFWAWILVYVPLLMHNWKWPLMLKKYAISFRKHYEFLLDIVRLKWIHVAYLAGNAHWTIRKTSRWMVYREMTGVVYIAWIVLCGKMLFFMLNLAIHTFGLQIWHFLVTNPFYYHSNHKILKAIRLGHLYGRQVRPFVNMTRVLKDGR